MKDSFGGTRSRIVCDVCLKRRVMSVSVDSGVVIAFGGYCILFVRPRGSRDVVGSRDFFTMFMY